MKKTLNLFFIIFIITLTAYSQEEFSEIDGKTYKFKTDTYVKISDSKTGDILNSFYMGPDISSKKTKIAYPLSKKESNRTSLAQLKDRVFKIIDILEPGKEGRRYKMLVLEDINNGEKLYYHGLLQDYPPFVVSDPVLIEAKREEERKKEERDLVQNHLYAQIMGNTKKIF